MLDATQFVSQNTLILIPFLYFIGMFLKSTSKVNDKYIPMILLGISVISCICLLGFKYNSIIQGVLIAGTTVFTNQLIKQTDSKE